VPRVKRGTKRRASRQKTLALASGFFLTKSKLHRSAQEAVERALKFALYWPQTKEARFPFTLIIRIGAATKASGLNYSKFMHGSSLPASSWTARCFLRSLTMMPRVSRNW